MIYRSLLLIYSDDEVNKIERSVQYWSFFKGMTRFTGSIVFGRFVRWRWRKFDREETAPAIIWPSETIFQKCFFPNCIFQSVFSKVYFPKVYFSKSVFCEVYPAFMPVRLMVMTKVWSAWDCPFNIPSTKPFHPSYWGEQEIGTRETFFAIL